MRRSVILVLCAIVTALSAITAIFPFVFFIPALVAVTLQNRKLTIFCGFIFGLISFIYSYLRPSLVSPFFQSNPLLPIIPRILAALLAHEAYRLIYHISKSRIAAGVICGLVGSISNTVFVISGLVLFAKDYQYSGISMLLEAIVVLVGISAAIEIVVNIGTVASISTALYKNKKINTILFNNAPIAIDSIDDSESTFSQNIAINKTNSPSYLIETDKTKE